MDISQIPVKFIFHSYSESSIFGRPGLGRCSPHQMAILQIPALLWELIFSRPTVKWWFHRFLWNSYFIPTWRAQHLTDQVLAHLPLSSKAISQIPTLFWKLIFGRQSVGRSTPHPPMVISQMLAHLPLSSKAISQIPTLLWKLIFGRPSVGRSTPKSNGNFTDSCSTLRAHI